jgi:hypothetical protein
LLDGSQTQVVSNRGVGLAGFDSAEIRSTPKFNGVRKINLISREYTKSGVADLIN